MTNGEYSEPGHERDPSNPETFTEDLETWEMACWVPLTPEEVEAVLQKPDVSFAIMSSAEEQTQAQVAELLGNITDTLGEMKEGVPEEGKIVFDELLGDAETAVNPRNERGMESIEDAAQLTAYADATKILRQSVGNQIAIQHGYPSPDSTGFRDTIINKTAHPDAYPTPYFQTLLHPDSDMTGVGFGKNERYTSQKTENGIPYYIDTQA